MSKYNVTEGVKIHDLLTRQWTKMSSCPMAEVSVISEVEMSRKLMVVLQMPIRSKIRSLNRPASRNLWSLK